MKSEEFIPMIHNAVNAPSAREGDDDVMNAIREIQADALRHAAKICQSRMTTLKNNAYNLGCNECRIFIEAEAKKLEEQ